MAFEEGSRWKSWPKVNCTQKWPNQVKTWCSLAANKQESASFLQMSTLKVANQTEDLICSFPEQSMAFFPLQTTSRTVRHIAMIFRYEIRLQIHAAFTSWFSLTEKHKWIHLHIFLNPYNKVQTIPNVILCW